jgi:hypothetical protein
MATCPNPERPERCTPITFSALSGVHRPSPAVTSQMTHPLAPCRSGISQIATSKADHLAVPLKREEQVRRRLPGVLQILVRPSKNTSTRYLKRQL